MQDFPVERTVRSCDREACRLSRRQESRFSHWVPCWPPLSSPSKRYPRYAIAQGTTPPIPFSLLQARNTKTNQIKQTQAEQTLLRRVCVRTRFDWLTAAIAPFNDSKPSRMSPGVSNISRCSGYSIGDVRRRDAAAAGGRLRSLRMGGGAWAGHNPRRSSWKGPRQRKLNRHLDQLL